MPDTQPDFRELVETWRQPRRAGQDSRTFEEVATGLGISRAYLYGLMAGAYAPPPSRVAEFAKAMRLSFESVDLALRRSQTARGALKRAREARNGVDA